MKQQFTSLALGSALAIAALSPAVAAANPFESTKLSQGYQVAQADMKKDDMMKKDGMMKKGDMKQKDGSCGADKKKDGKCGEAKCGADKKS